MENAKREWPPVRRPRKRRANLRPVALILALVLLVGGVVGGTIAWLTADTGEIKNTFTAGDIDITLTESDDLNLKMIPGHTIKKDPRVTVVGGSEPCWVFIEVKESENLDTFIDYTIDPNNWTEVEEGVYAIRVANPAEDHVIKIIGNEETVKVKDTVTKADMDALTANNQPTLSFTAYAVQLMKDNTTEFTAADAWAKINPATP